MLDMCCLFSVSQWRVQRDVRLCTQMSWWEPSKIVQVPHCCFVSRRLNVLEGVCHEIVSKRKRWKLEFNGKSLTSLHVSVCTACDSVLTWCNESVVHFSRCVISFGDFQRVTLARSTHRYTSLMAVRVRRRSCRDCRHQSAQEPFDAGLTWFAIDNIGCGSRKCLSLQWRRFGQLSRQWFSSWMLCNVSLFLCLPMCFELFGLWFTLFCSTTVIVTTN